MQKNPLSFFQLVVFTIISLFCFLTDLRSQTIEPDEQIAREMIAFVTNAEDALSLSRPRIVGKPSFAEKISSDRAENVAGLPANIYSLERKAFEIINEQRAEEGLKPLEWNDDLAVLARRHSENMARDKFFSHQGRDGSLVNHRADRLGVSQWRAIGENIAFNRGFKKPVESACQQWMNSPPHRQNILSKRWGESGIGIAIAPDGSYYFTQVFIVR